MRMSDWKDIRTGPAKEMMQRVARFKDLKDPTAACPDSPLARVPPRKLYAVIGFQPPMPTTRQPLPGGQRPPSAMPAIAIAEGFNSATARRSPARAR